LHSTPLFLPVKNSAASVQLPEVFQERLCAVSQLKMTVVQFWTIAQVATAVDGKDSDAGWLACYQFSM